MPSYIAVRTFAIGGTGRTIQKGDIVDFDGTTAYFSDAGLTQCPALQGAVMTGWLTPIPAVPRPAAEPGPSIWELLREL